MRYLLLASFFIAPWLLAKELSEENGRNQTYIASCCHEKEDSRWITCCNSHLPYRFSLSHTAGNGLGYENDGYSSLAFFLTPENLSCGSYYTIFDLRGHLFDNGRQALNFGAGGRYYFPSYCFVLGTNLYYDFRSSELGYFHQLGLGIECITPRFSAHVNGYFPFNDACGHTHLEDTYIGPYFSFYREKGISLKGMDVDFRTCLLRLNHSKIGSIGLSASAGYYFYSVSRDYRDQNVRGVRGCLVCSLNDLFSVEFVGTSDNTFGKKAQVRVEISLPLCFYSKRENKKKCCSRFLYQSIERNEIITFDEGYVWDPNW